MTPSGVEQESEAVEALYAFFVTETMTPSGVEQILSPDDEWYRAV